LPEGEVTGVGGDAARLGRELISIAAGGGVARGLGAYRGGEVDGDGRYMFTNDLDAILLASGSAEETTVVVGTK
jgi:hypothetical protein